MEKDLYATLEVSKNATADELKKQYRILSKKYHPDMQAGKTDDEKKAAEEKFKEITAAYATLSDPEKRQHYDRFGTIDGSESPFGGFKNPFDFFSSMFGNDGPGFGGGFGGFGFNSNPPKRDINDPEDGSDIEFTLGVDLSQVAFGTKVPLTIDKSEECQHCHGKGVDPSKGDGVCKRCKGQGHIVERHVSGICIHQTIMECPDCHGLGYEPCPKCHGKKRTYEPHIIELTIPQSISYGKCLKVRGLGECGVKGGANGDIRVRIMPSQHENGPFMRKNNDYDLQMVFPIDPLTATFGGKVEIPTLWGKSTAEIPKMTKTGDVVVVDGAGLKNVSGFGAEYGNLALICNVMPLTNLSDEQKTALEAIAKQMTSKNADGLDEIFEKIEEMKK